MWVQGSLSVDHIYDKIRGELGKDYLSKNRLILRFDGEELVVFDAGSSFSNALSYLKDCDKIRILSPQRGDFNEEEEIVFRAADDDEVENVIKPKLDEPKEEKEKEDQTGGIRFRVVEDSNEDIRFSIRGDEDEKSNSEGGHTMFKTKPRQPSYDDEYYIRMIEMLQHPQRTTPPKRKAETRFNEQMIRTAKQVHELMKDLLLQGFPAEILKDWINENVKLSRLRITKQFKVLLVDYDREVDMGPPPMTVFLFFLRHPEGVRLSYLQDHVDELRKIYGRVSVNDDLQKMEASIAALIDPFNNSICEKCAAVKKAFMLAVEDSIARNYYITGEQGKKKGILLDRSLVEWECEL